MEVMVWWRCGGVVWCTSVTVVMMVIVVVEAIVMHKN